MMPKVQLSSWLSHPADSTLKLTRVSGAPLSRHCAHTIRALQGLGSAGAENHFWNAIPQTRNGQKTALLPQPTDRASAGCRPRGSRPQRHECRSGRMRRLQAGVPQRGAQVAGTGRGRAGRSWPAARWRLHGKLTARPLTATACTHDSPSPGRLRWPLGPW